MVRSSIVVTSIASASGHGHLTWPPSTRMGGLLATGGDCTQGQCDWFSNNIEIPGEETLPKEFRTVTNGGSPDVFATAPWRAPGTAPVYGSGCGVAGGGPRPFANGGNAPKGYAQGSDGVDAPRKMDNVKWQIGSIVDVAWAISANHGGGYHYRLCKKSDGVSEECFQRTPLKFAGNTSFIIHSDGTVVNEFPMRKVTVGTYPPGSEWAMDPIPGCKMCEDVLAECGAPMDPVPQDEEGGGWNDPWNQQVDCYGACCGSSSSKAHGACPEGTEFYPGLSGHTGFGKNVPEWSMMDKVVIPEDLEEGEYFLGWRWDCEESTQVWENCADIELTKDAAPSPPFPPAPAPSPGPSPSPQPSKGSCKVKFENPTCQAWGKSCKEQGCQKCADDEGWDCEVCCPGCDLMSTSGYTLCQEPKEDISV